MSVYDVAAVDRLSNLQNKRSGGRGSNTSSRSSSKSSQSGSHGNIHNSNSGNTGHSQHSSLSLSRGHSRPSGKASQSASGTGGHGFQNCPSGHVSLSSDGRHSISSASSQQKAYKTSAGAGVRVTYSNNNASSTLSGHMTTSSLSLLSPSMMRRGQTSTAGSFSPIVLRDKKSDAIKESFAKYHASLSRPESPHSRFNDDIPHSRFNDDLPSCNRYQQAPSRRNDTHFSDGHQLALPILPGGHQSHLPGGSNHSGSHRNDIEYRAYSQSNFTQQGEFNHDREASSRLWDTLPSRRPSSNRDSFYEEEPINVLESRYPYLSPAAVSSLPRNTKLLKMNQKFAETIKESENILARSSQNLAAMESRELLLKRYPSKSPGGSCRTSPGVLSPNRSLRSSPEKMNSLFSPVGSTRSSPVRSTRGSPTRRSNRCSPPRSNRQSPVRSNRGSPTRSVRTSPTRSIKGSPTRLNRESPIRPPRGLTRSNRPSPVRSVRGSPTRSNRASPARSVRGSPTRQSTRESPTRYNRGSPTQSYTRGLHVQHLVRSSNRSSPMKSPLQSLRASPANSLRSSPSRSRRSSPDRRSHRSVQSNRTYDSAVMPPYANQRYDDGHYSGANPQSSNSYCASNQRYTSQHDDPRLYDQYHHHHHQQQQQPIYPNLPQQYAYYGGQDGDAQQLRIPMSICTSPRSLSRPTSPPGSQMINSPCCSHRSSRNSSPARSSRKSSPSRNNNSMYVNQVSRKDLHAMDCSGCPSHSQHHGEDHHGCSCHSNHPSCMPPVRNACQQVSPVRNMCQPAQPYPPHYSSIPGTPNISRGSSRAGSPSRYTKEPRHTERLDKVVKSRRPSDVSHVSSAGPSVSRIPSQSSSRAGSPTSRGGARSGKSHPVSKLAEERIMLPQQGGNSTSVGGGPCLMYVRETFQIINPDKMICPEQITSGALPFDLLRSLSSKSINQSSQKEPNLTPPRQSNDTCIDDRNTTADCKDNRETSETDMDNMIAQNDDFISISVDGIENKDVDSVLNTEPYENFGENMRSSSSQISTSFDIRKLFDEDSLDNQHQETSLENDQGEVSSLNTQLQSGSLDKASIQSIEQFLASIRPSIGDVGRAEDPAHQHEHHDDGVEAHEDLDDSARAESLVSGTSIRSPESVRSAVSPIYITDEIGDPHSTIRRQSVIIEGLSMEADELKRKVFTLEDELSSVPIVNNIQSKLNQVESKLEETETFAYQVVEENVTLKSEIETLEAEISEVEDTFRENDAKEFKRVKWELENLAKSCRNLQLKLGKSQAKANRLRAEKERIEEKKREEKQVWKKTAVLAAAIIAGFHIISGKMK